MSKIETSTTDTTLPFSTFDVELPDEILFYIFDLAVSMSTLSVRASWLRISKAVHQLIIPLVYHTVDLDTERGNCVSWSNPTQTDRTNFLNTNPDSFLLVRRLKTYSFSRPPDFSIFPNVTHLALWGSHKLSAASNGVAVLRLPLEELVIYDTEDNDFLQQHLSPEVAAFWTLRKLVTFSFRGDHPQERWFSCPNLSNILDLWNIPSDLWKSSLSGVSTRPQLKCYILAPQSPKLFNWASTIKSIVPSDRRVVLLPHRLVHINFGDSAQTWDGQAILWRMVEDRIQANPNPKEPTVIDSLSELMGII
ncbi:hypothetical protein DL96DRAFT_1627514 [Flagelloscypha sp. PMI_526]|nr:hypothetical protein DL96DRAFT_1627514 [Flagelloscypha sp. PMI_526]